ncbi:probable L-type lectin-domain containing receptor kinase VI.1 [Ziziphus jujuba]|uniref:Probable L-type lectin-domain containing receptor kinase VI.1 n=1 Tax=Ziziphus jujuba TaxID=326968 RepID=A0A6P3Z2P4_ZIZJJ|nr:probable L-type lectin-domain containing receptor kinase VI.1 [Ziziphus jujuba]
MALPGISISSAFLFFFLLPSLIQLLEASSFTFNNGFNGKESDLTLQNGATIDNQSGLLKLTNTSYQVTGQAFYSKPIQMFAKDSTPNKTHQVSSFSTSFVFAMVNPRSRPGGYGLAFTISPSAEFPGAEAGHFFGIFNPSNVNNSSNHIFLVEFDTVDGFNETEDNTGNHVGVNFNSVNSTLKKIAGYYGDSNPEEKRYMILDSTDGELICAWIEYDGVEKLLNVTIFPTSLQKKPNKALISRHVDLTSVFNEKMFVGFSASTGKMKSSSHYILGWSFAMDGKARELKFNLLPKLPNQDGTSSLKPQIIALIAGLCALLLTLFVILGYLTLYKRMTKTFEILEDWELDCPHRFKFKDLHTATKGFKDSELIGVGGFGAVYKGVLPSTGCEVAVKKITKNSLQGIRDFAAEVESLGQLRHKNLVNLQGWCKKKNNLIIVYDYIPNGSLDSLIFNPRGNIFLTWERRFNIFKGIAEGLLYLHEEYQQVVIHRDVKSSNVLIDSDMNARLSDFGLARLHDHHGEISHTTGVVGTIGYIAPELARTGKASTATDVFAYGVLLLEVACGKRPIGSGNFILVDWVTECCQMGRLLDVVDPKFGSEFAVEEMELVLKLGLLCSYHKPEARPSMRQVVRYLNGDDLLPVFDGWGTNVESQGEYRLSTRCMEVTSNGTSTSIGAGVSFNSINIGR